MGKKFFVAGTDTEIGKTTVACGLLAAANQLGLRTLALKPLAAGADNIAGELRNEDALALMDSASVKLAYEQVNPVLFDPPIAPHIAAQQAGKRITVSQLAGYCRGALMTSSDFALVEGAGGWRVPLSGRETLAGLAVELQLPVILVVGMKLGCLNHALLTAEAIQRDGLPLAGWVANTVDPQMACFDDNIATLKHFLPAPCLGVIPRLQDAQGTHVAPHLDLAQLVL